ncbi:MAG: sigma-70 family RNA polymerase sigma factor [Planctomycetes bacterium]|nr:sigma-70 family RNA polymerase sigma factor [Planctomycetota bacterium]
MVQTTSSQLFRQFRDEGKLSAFSEICDRLRPELLRVAQRLVRDTEAAEDAVQEAFLKAIEKATSFDSERPFEPWILGILGLEIRSARRRRRPSPPIEESIIPARPEFDPAEAQEIVSNLDSALRELPDSSREVSLLCLREGLTPKEAARLLGRPASTVRSQLERGRQRLMEVLPKGLSLGVFLATLPERGDVAAASLKAKVGVCIMRLTRRRRCHLLRFSCTVCWRLPSCGASSWSCSRTNRSTWKRLRASSQ